MKSAPRKLKGVRKNKIDQVILEKKQTTTKKKQKKQVMIQVTEIGLKLKSTNQNEL